MTAIEFEATVISIINALFLAMFIVAFIVQRKELNKNKK
jgi:hypothetical protein